MSTIFHIISWKAKTKIFMRGLKVTRPVPEKHTINFFGLNLGYLMIIMDIRITLFEGLVFLSEFIIAGGEENCILNGLF